MIDTCPLVSVKIVHGQIIIDVVLLYIVGERWMYNFRQGELRHQDTYTNLKRGIGQGYYRYLTVTQTFYYHMLV